jgi:hypothetical protein
MTIRSIAARCGTAARVGCCIAAMAFPVGAQAQADSSESPPAAIPAPVPKPQTMGRLVMSSCAADYARFCPGPADRLVNPREEVLCLKYFKSDLSLSCRRAVNAFSR